MLSNTAIQFQTLAGRGHIIRVEVHLAAIQIHDATEQLRRQPVRTKTRAGPELFLLARE